MSGSGKKVVDVAVKAGKAIDWDGMAKMLVSEEARKEFATLRRTFEDVNHQLQTKFSQVPDPCSLSSPPRLIWPRVSDLAPLSLILRWFLHLNGSDPFGLSIGKCRRSVAVSVSSRANLVVWTFFMHVHISLVSAIDFLLVRFLIVYLLIGTPPR
jgi:hypothetical protein